ncbi:MAG: tetraacyldisaccharide 4'-kinase [Candidatus Omnitrophica bacterium]|nr:tetraacyldisaccharide 4'-kinase [Candidatus Omnitrophota bacterium]
MRDYLYRVITDQAGGPYAAVIRFFLWLLSFIYAGMITVRNICFDRGFPKIVDLGKPVISVGNLTWGGVGKTPFVVFLAEHLKVLGFAPAVLMRGYMKSAAPSDEAEVLRQAVPGMDVGVGADRAKSAHQLIMKQPVDVFILDDGFQHRKVKRGLNVLLIDANNPFGNGELIPRGILREPVEAMRRADVIILTKTDINPSAAKALEERINRIHPSCPVAWAVHQPRSFVDIFSGEENSLSGGHPQKTMSFCSIGDPDHFVGTLAKIGLESQRNFIFPDHHVYTEQDIKNIVATAQKAGVDALLTTSKDAVKIAQFNDIFGSLKCLILKIQFEVEVGKEEVVGRVDRLLGR